MQIEQIKIAELKEYDKNSRTHNKKQVEQICESIKEFGFTNPVLVDEDNILIAGHGRVAAAKKLKLKEVPAIRLSGLTEAQKKALRIADNRLALNAGWDEALLREEIIDLQQDDYNLSLLGFTDAELDSFLKDEEEEDEPEVEFAEVLGEQHNYVVLYFDNEVDWLQAESLFDIKPVKCGSTRRDKKIDGKMQRIGIGRVLKGSEALTKIMEAIK